MGRAYTSVTDIRDAVLELLVIELDGLEVIIKSQVSLPLTFTGWQSILLESSIDFDILTASLWSLFSLAMAKALAILQGQN